MILPSSTGLELATGLIKRLDAFNMLPAPPCQFRTTGAVLMLTVRNDMHFCKRIVFRNPSRAARRLRRGTIEGLPAFMAASVQRQRLQPLFVGSRRSPATHPQANLRITFRGGSRELPRFDPPTKRTIHRDLR